MNFLAEICYSFRLKNLENMEFYEEGERSAQQIIWIWYLTIFRDFCQSMINDPGFMNTALYFIKHFYDRIAAILMAPNNFIKDKNKSKEFKNNNNISIDNFFSLAVIFNIK